MNNPKIDPYSFNSNPYLTSIDAAERIDENKKITEIFSLIAEGQLKEAKEKTKFLNNEHNKARAIGHIAHAYIIKNENETALSLINISEFTNIRVHNIALDVLIETLSQEGNVLMIINLFNRFSNINNYSTSKRIVLLMTMFNNENQALEIANLHNESKKHKLYRNIAITLADLRQKSCVEIADKIPIGSVIRQKTLNDIQVRTSHLKFIEIYFQNKEESLKHILEENLNQIKVLVREGRLTEAEKLADVIFSDDNAKSYKVHAKAYIACDYIKHNEIEKAFLLLNLSDLLKAEKSITNGYKELSEDLKNQCEFKLLESISELFPHLKTSLKLPEDLELEKDQNNLLTILFLQLADLGLSNEIIILFKRLPNINSSHFSKKIVEKMVCSNYLEEAIQIADFQKNYYKKYRLFSLIAVQLAKLNNEKCLQIADRIPIGSRFKDFDDYDIESVFKLPHLRGKTFYAIQVYAKDKSIRDRIFLDHSGYSKREPPSEQL